LSFSDIWSALASNAKLQILDYPVGKLAVVQLLLCFDQNFPHFQDALDGFLQGVLKSRRETVPQSLLIGGSSVPHFGDYGNRR
jgi:hypothetical protein